MPRSTDFDCLVLDKLTGGTAASMHMDYVLSLTILVPLAAVLLMLALPASNKAAFRLIALGATLIQLLLSVLIYLGFDPGTLGAAGVISEEGLRFVEKLDWISLDLGSFGQLSIQYYLGVDGLSISMVLLTGIVMVLGVLSSWRITEKVKGYFILYMLLSASIMGCFVALDMFLFYLFFEFMLLPMYFLIGIWGGPRREYASIKFFLYTLAGSILILVVMIGLYASVIDPVKTAALSGYGTEPEAAAYVQEQLQQGHIADEKQVHTFDMIQMCNPANYAPDSLLAGHESFHLFGTSLRYWAFLLLFIGLAIKLPAVPVHTWLPDAHVEAPTPISVVLAALLLKVGGYGLLRIVWGIFPDGVVHYAWFIGLVGVISIIYGALNALAQQDLKKLIAYSSVSHMGFVLLGLASGTAEGISGAIYQLFSHGLISALLFMVVGVIYDRTHDRQIGNYSGLTHQMPRFTVFVLIAFFASLGLPGMSGFIAELLVFLGAFASAGQNELLPRWFAIVSTIGLILGAAYYLWTLQRMFFGEFKVRQPDWKEALQDLSLREYVMMTPLVLATLLFGLWPGLLLDAINPAVNELVNWLQVSESFSPDLIKGSR